MSAILFAQFQSQVVVLVDEHKQNVARLQKQLDIAEDEITRLQRWNIAEGQQQQQKLQNAKEEETVADISLQERQEGEVSPKPCLAPPSFICV